MYHYVPLHARGKESSVPVRSDPRIVSNFDVVARHRASRFTSVVARQCPQGPQGSWCVYETYRAQEVVMVHSRVGFGSFEFAVLSSLRVAQLIRGCTPRVASTHKHITTAQLEVAAGLVTGLPVEMPAGASAGRPIRTPQL